MIVVNNLDDELLEFMLLISVDLDRFYPSKWFTIGCLGCERIVPVSVGRLGCGILTKGEFE